MATTFKVANVDKQPMMAHVYGNLAYALAKYTMPIGQAATDLIDFLRIPANCQIVDFYERHDGSNTAATTGSFGLAAVTGGPTTYVSSTYFTSATDLNAAGFNRWANSAVYSITTDGEYYVQCVIAGTTSAGAAMDIEVCLMYEYVGNN